MGRPRHTQPRDQQLNIALTQNELTTIRTRAARAGRRPADYVRRLLFGDTHAPRIEEIRAVQTDWKLHQQLTRLGNNLNQIARMMNMLRLPPPPDLMPLLQEIRRLIARGEARDH